MITPGPSSLLRLLSIEGSITRIDEALTHPSFANEHPSAPDYQRLELLGDAVLSLCVTELLLQRAPAADEGTLSRMRASLVNTIALAEFAHAIDLARWVRVGKGAFASGDVLQPKLLADVVEAIVGAVYLDRGLDGARAITSHIVGNSLGSMTDISRRDPKSELQERVQHILRATPTYHVVGQPNPNQEGNFDVEVRNGDTVLGRGQGRSKKAAERAAANAALEGLAMLSPQAGSS